MHTKEKGDLSRLVLISVCVWAGCSVPSEDGLHLQAGIKKKEFSLNENWSPILCPAVGSHTLVGPTWTDISIAKWQPIDAWSQNYANSTKTPYWPILFNQHVRSILLDFSRFDVPQNDYGDKLTFLYYNGSTTWNAANLPTSVMSNVSDGPYPIRPKQGATYAHFAWETNATNDAAGYKLSSMYLWCVSPCVSGIARLS